MYSTYRANVEGDTDNYCQSHAYKQQGHTSSAFTLTRKHYRGMHHGTTARIISSPYDLYYKGPVARAASGIKFICKVDRQNSYPSRSRDKPGLKSVGDAAAASTRSRKPGMEICTGAIVPRVLLRSL